MPRQWVKEEVKKDFLRDVIEKSVDYIKNNREKSIIALAVAVIIVVVATMTVNRFNKAAALADEQVGFVALYLKSGAVDQAIQLADQVVSMHPGGRQGGYANFYKGEALFRKKDYENAAKYYSIALPLLQKTQDLGAIILLDIGKSYEAAGKYQQALSSYKELTDKYSSHYTVPDAQMGMARCYEITGDIKAAVTAYQNIASMNSATIYRTMAEARLRMLQPQQPAPQMPILKQNAPVKPK
jgi:tetratricopeptide (TPR) repeat protein